MGKYDLSERDTAEPALTATPSGGSKYDLRSEPAAAPSTAPGRTWWDTAKSAGQTVADAAVAAGSSGTFGMDVRRDAFSGWLAGDYPSYSAGVEAEQKRLEKHRERSPIASVAGDVAGAAALPGMGGAGLAARGVKAGLAPWLARAGGYGIEGAGVGAGQAAGTTYSGVPSDYVKNAITGGALGFGLGGTFGSILGPRNLAPRSTAEIPTAAVSGDARTLAYDALRANPAQYHPPAARQLADRIEPTLAVGAADAPVSFRELNKMRNFDNWPTSQSVTPYQFETVVKNINKIPFNPLKGEDRAAGREIKSAINDFFINPPPGAVRPGSEAAAKQASELATFARGQHGATKRMEVFEGLQNAAKRDTDLGRTGGRSLPDATASQIDNWYFPANAATLAKRQRGHTPEEIAALDKAVSPGGATQFMRDKGVVLTGGRSVAGNIAAPIVAGGLGGGAGYLSSDPKWGTLGGLAFPLLGAGMRGAASRNTARNIQHASDLIHTRNPLYEKRAAAAPMVLPEKSGSQMLRDAITAGLVGQGFGQVDSVEDEPLRITVNPRR
jgi:hypothetical protein